MFFKFRRSSSKTCINTGPGLAQSDFEILTALKKLLKISDKSNFLDEVNYIDVNANKIDFSKVLVQTKPQSLNKLNFTHFKAHIDNFFSTGLIAKNSLTLNKCAKNLKSVYINFKK